MNKTPLTANIFFSGIGAQERGFLDSELFDLKVLNTSEIDKDAVLSYATIHCGLTEEMINNYSNYPSRQEMADFLTDINLGFNPEKQKKYNWNRFLNSKKNVLEKYWLACKLSNNLGDISKIENVPYADLWTCSFPCTDISVAGNMKGLNPNDKTRSSLLWENIRLLKQAKQNNTLPQYIMFENVKNLVGKKFINDFYNLLDVLDELGFHTYWSVINGKDCGIPQNRERVFAVCIRKDIDKKKYNFPEPFDTGVRLIDILEDNVSEKYYLDDKKIEGFLQEFKEDIIKRISKNNNKNEIDVLGKLNIKGKDNIRRVYNPYGLSPTLNTMQGGNRQPKIIVAMRGRNPENPSDRTTGMPTKQKLEANYKGVCNTLTSVQKDNLVMEFPELFGIDKSITHFRDIDYANCLTTREDRGLSNRKGEGTAILEKNAYKIRIRKLTPTECGLLMGFTNEDVQKMRAIGISDSALYKQFGNSIITNCVKLLAEHLYKAQYNDMHICTDKKYANNIPS